MTEITGTLPEARGLLSLASAAPPDAGRRRRAARRRPGAHRRARGLRPRLVRGPDRLAGGRRRRRAVRRAAVRDRRPDAGDPVRRLRDRRRLGPGPEWEESRIKLRAVVSALGHPGGRAHERRAALLRAFVAELVAAGVRDAVVCPGSRSTPLALALARQRRPPGPRPARRACRRLLRRSGMARTARRPVVLLVTSGTAAWSSGRPWSRRRYSRVPLVVLTADRPPELRDRGAPQTIDQDHLYGRLREVVRRAAAARRRPGDRGPRPLRGGTRRRDRAGRAGGAGAPQRAVPRAAAAGSARSRRAGPVDAAGARPRRSRSPVAARVLTTDARRARRRVLGRTAAGLIVAGPDDDPALPAALAALAAGDGVPDPRRPAVRAAHGPPRPVDVVVARRPARPARAVDRRPPARPRDPDRARCRPPSRSLPAAGADAAGADRPRRRRRLARAGAAARRRSSTPTPAATARGARRAPRAAAPADGLGDATGSTPSAPRRPRRWTGWLAALDEPFEGAPFAALGRRAPRRGACCGPATRCRSATWTAGCRRPSRAITVRSNRGANGIDGVVSTALGSAAVGGAARSRWWSATCRSSTTSTRWWPRSSTGCRATIVLVNNDGGGIFSFLPQATDVDPELGAARALRGAVRDAARDRRRADRDGARRRAPRASGRPTSGRDRRSIGRPGVQVLELRTDRARNVELHASAAAAVAPRPSAADERDRSSTGCAGRSATAGPAAAAAAPRLHRGAGRLGRARRRLSRARSADRRRPPRPRPQRGPGRPGRAMRRALRGRPGRDPAPRSRPRPRDVIGYSLGARIALRLAVAHPDVVGRLVPREPVGRDRRWPSARARRAADEALADRIERDGIEAFVDEWEAQPIFASQGRAAAARAARIRAHPPRATAPRASPPACAAPARARWSRSPTASRGPRPTLVIAGALDDAAGARADRSPPAIPGARLAVVDGAGHTPHDERPPPSAASSSTSCRRTAA